MSETTKKYSPMMTHYLNLKEKYKDCIIFYRLGDFYEMFFEDAITCSKVLEITLTGRDCGLNEKAPMCGVPFHSADTYIKKLIDNNFKVAICEQLTQPTKGVKIVERDIIKIITPGTITDNTMLEEKKNNYICSVYLSDNKIGVTYCDISTGEFSICEFTDDASISNLNDLLIRINPSEILSNEAMFNLSSHLSCVKNQVITKFEKYKEWAYNKETAIENITKQFGNNAISNFEMKNMHYAICSSGALIEYLYETQKTSITHINRISKVNNNEYMILDPIARKNLEISETIRDRKKVGSLLWLLDETKTSMGGRLFRNWLSQPLINPKLINKRLDAVEELVSKIILRNELSNHLSKINDIERIISKLACGNFTPRDCIALKNSLSLIPSIKQSLLEANLKSDLLLEIQENLLDFNSIVYLLESAIQSDPPNTVKDGGFIKKTYNSQLMEYIDALDNGKSWITKLEAREKEETGIRTLKVGYNSVFGYYIEVSKSFMSQVPLRYVRKQTLANNERYITEELKELENKILNAEDLSIKLEQQIFNEIKQNLCQSIKDFQLVASNLATLDSLLSLSIVAIKGNYCKPKINAKINHIKIEEGRHPVVEALSKSQFITNDTLLDNESNKIMVITGPNMAGKSTYMRQVAVITLMAHIGSFVPAKSAEIAITDRMFTRVGASDDLAFGQSTFMVEMSELSNILHNATPKSLIILDEIGRGTSTFDGLSIAWAVVEYLAKTLKAKTLFATHYHELTELETFLMGVKNYKITVKEYNNSIIFLRKIVRGGANKSFGIEVASLAGVPEVILNRAREISEKLEETDLQRNINTEASKLESNKEKIKNHTEVISILNDIDINKLSPLMAFEILCDLVKRLKDE